MSSASASSVPSTQTTAPVPSASLPSPREEASGLVPVTELLHGVALATEVVQESVEALDATAVRAPSLLPGWSRAHVITHLARNADALVNLLTWAKTGVEHPAYASRADRDADIEEGANRPLQLLRADLDSACLRFAAAAEALTPSAWNAEISPPAGASIPAHRVPFLRLRELWFHLVDLNVGTGFGDLPPERLEAFVDDAVCVLRTHDDAPPLRLVVELPDGRQRTWEVAAGGASPDEVRGSAADVLAWLTGRHDGTGLIGTTPELPDWA
ncbi:maleylpyruvate isomerase family mycothiol-dependent enzyme [Umezawaea sp. REN6]|uniref:maleylpyruvate isomerase family mycothiol-dependent enzyme n=1 Tax=Umezawaea beigongshangensis TaxID=2780383 RepID=UPI0018F274E8